MPRTRSKHEKLFIISLIGILVFVVGLVVGSFVNVLIHRLPRGENFIVSRSRCPACSSQLKWFELIPLVSYIFLIGKCRTCKAEIAINYPLVELASGLLVYFAWTAFPSNPWLAFFWIVVLFCFLTLLLFDLNYYILPDTILLFLGVFLVAYRLATGYFDQRLLLVSWREAIIAAVVLSVLFGALWFFSRGRWLGFGDVKLVFVLGLVFGYASGIILYGAVIVGGVVALLLLIFKKANLKSKLPLGTFISGTAIVYVFYQEPLYKLVRQLFL